jgi:dynein heavy chain
VPIVHMTSSKREDRKTKGFYECPVYTTSARGATYVFTSFLQMESEDSDPHRWVLGGVALVMQPE